MRKDHGHSQPWQRRREEIAFLFKLALPTMFTQLLRFINPSVSIMVCGHLSREELDAASLATTIINVFGLCVDSGFSSAFDTLFSQAYGSRNRRMLGVFLQRALMVVIFIYAALACVHMNIEPILLLLKQDPLISSLTTEYLRCFLPGLACDFIFLVLARYLQAQNIVLPMAFASAVGTVFNLVTQYVFVLRMNLGLRVSALCLSGTFAVMLLIEIAYIMVSKVYFETWTGFDPRAAICNWGVIFRMGIPGLFMVSLEEWCFEMLTFIAGAMGEVVLGAHAITFQIQSIIYMIPLGIFTAVNIRVGQKLGSFDPEGARYTYKTSIAVVGILALSTGIPVIVLRHQLPHIFTDEESICALSTKLLPLLLLFQLCEGFAGVSEAVLLACGRHSTGAVIIFLGYYCTGVPIALFLGYRTSLAILGCWIGLLIGFGITTFAYVILAHNTDWIAEAQKARKNVHDQEVERMPELLFELEQDGVFCREPTSQLTIALSKSRFWPQYSETLRYSCSLIWPRCHRWRTKCLRVPVLLLIVSISLWCTLLYTYISQTTPLWATHCTSSQRNATFAPPTFCQRMTAETELLPFFFTYG